MLRRITLIDDIKELKVLYLILTLCALAGLCLGFASGNNALDAISAADLNVRAVEIIFYSGKGLFGIFFSAVLKALFSTLIIFVFTANIYLMPVSFVFIIYRGFRVGYNALIFIRSFSFGGSLFMIIIYLPIQLLLTACLIISAGFCCNRCLEYRHCNAFQIKNAGYETALFKCIPVFIINLIICLFEAILISILYGSLAII